MQIHEIIKSLILVVIIIIIILSFKFIFASFAKLTLDRNARMVITAVN